MIRSGLPSLGKESGIRLIDLQGQNYKKKKEKVRKKIKEYKRNLVKMVENKLGVTNMELLGNLNSPRPT